MLRYAFISVIFRFQAYFFFILGPPVIDPYSVTCNSLKVKGTFQPGIYTLKEANQSPRLGYCQMDQDGYKGNMETPLGYFDTFIDPEVISFAAYKSTPGYTNMHLFVTFNHIVYNHGNGLDKDTGAFTAPKTGIYQFSFQGRFGGSGSNDECMVIVVKNNVFENTVQKFIVVNDDSQWVVGTSTWIMDLEANDVIKIKVNKGQVFSGPLATVNYSGYLVRERA